jgi:DNA-binding protein HU-beta
MNKADLILAVAEEAKLPKREAEAAVEALLALVEKALVKKEEVKLSGFGVFENKKRAPRIGTNPTTGAKIKIPASNTVSFKPSKSLKEKVN